MYDKEKNIFLNPFLNADDSENFKIENGKYSEILLKNRIQFTEKNIKIVYGNDEIISLMDDCIKNNMTPLLVRTIERMVNKSEIFSYLPYEHVEIDLKYYYIKLREYSIDSPEINTVYDEIKKKFIDAMTNGKFLILNFDDCQIQYDELFDPDLKEIYGNFMFTPLMWQPQKFAEPANFSAHVHGRRDLKYNPNFKFIVYSKYLISDITANEKQLKTIIEKKFGKCFPLKYMNVYVLSKPPKEEKKEEENKEQENANVPQGKN